MIRVQKIEQALREAPFGRSVVLGVRLEKTEGRSGISKQNQYRLEGRERYCNLRWAIHHLSQILRNSDDDDG